MANYHIKLVLRPELVLRSSYYPKSKVTHCSSELRQVSKGGYWPLNLPSSCEIVEKVEMGSFGAPIFRDGIRQILNKQFQTWPAYFRACGKVWLSFVQ